MMNFNIVLEQMEVLPASQTTMYIHIRGSITPSPWVKPRNRGNGPETWPGANPPGGGDVASNLPALGGEPSSLLGWGGGQLDAGCSEVG